MVNAFFYSNIAVATTLSGNINNAVTSATVAATTGWPTSYPFIIAIDYGAANEELVQVTNNAAGTLTIVRGYGGTSAVAHSTGAVVRHVYNGQDATDFRTHEAAASDVHGVTGALVGATMAQTLTNKTLTSPTINAGALTGTFTGTPTFSGNLVFTGVPVFQQAAAANIAFAASQTGDANSRLRVAADGTINWGPGNAVTDTNLYRSAANFLKTDDALVVVGELQPQNLVRANRANATDSQYETRVTGDSIARWFMQADGKQFWGSGAGAVDTSLYRSAVDTLKTDDNFVVNLDLSVGDTTWTTFTPTWTVGGSPTFNTNVGWYKKIGKIVFFEIYTVWSSSGSGTTNIQGNLPSTPYRDGNGANTTRQFISGFITATNITSPGMIMGQILAGGAGTAFGVNLYDNNAIQGQHIQNNTIATLQGWYREA